VRGLSVNEALSSTGGGRAASRRAERLRGAHDQARRGAGLAGGLPPAHDDPRRRPTDRARVVAAIDDPRASADREMSAPIWAWFPTASVGRGRLRQRHLEMRGQALRTLLYEAANVMLTRYKGQLQTQGLGLMARKRSITSATYERRCPPKKPPGDTRGTFCERGSRRSEESPRVALACP
jgi:hypothetical protein